MRPHLWNFRKTDSGFFVLLNHLSTVFEIPIPTKINCKKTFFRWQIWNPLPSKTKLEFNLLVLILTGTRRVRPPRLWAPLLRRKISRRWWGWSSRAWGGGWWGAQPRSRRTRCRFSEPVCPGSRVGWWGRKGGRGRQHMPSGRGGSTKLEKIIKGVDIN